uniref:Uncharacterized protein n=1 Tax=Anguilla anguilla TaxID=7936 RepID=A0A0E9VM98_ANGAN
MLSFHRFYNNRNRVAVVSWLFILLALDRSLATDNNG